MRRSGALVVAVLAAAAGCDEIDTFSGDPFPIGFVSRAGAVTVEVRAVGELPRPTVLDVLSPFTVLDYGPDTERTRRPTTLDLLGLNPAGGAVSRARFTGTVFHWHPCEGEAVCAVGDPATPHSVNAILGADLLAGDAIRFDFADQQLFVLPDIAGDATTRADLCDGLFPRPFQGQGTLLVEGAEVAFSSRRIVIEGCLGPNTAPMAPARGGDVLLVLSTGLGPNVLAESAYLRYAEAAGIDVDLLALPTVTVRNVSGPIMGRLATVPELALVGTANRNPRGACREVYASEYLETALAGVCDDPMADPAAECPCEPSDDRSCGAPAVVRLAPTAGVDLVLVPDDDPLLQALRAELRPLVGEIDGVLGTNALAPLVLDVDYPHDRLLWRCGIATPGAPDGCQVRPQLSTLGRQEPFQACLAGDD
jgi:hypothetical protein